MEQQVPIMSGLPPSLWGAEPCRCRPLLRISLPFPLLLRLLLRVSVRNAPVSFLLRPLLRLRPLQKAPLPPPALLFHRRLRHLRYRGHTPSLLQCTQPGLMVSSPHKEDGQEPPILHTLISTRWDILNTLPMDSRSSNIIHTIFLITNNSNGARRDMPCTTDMPQHRTRPPDGIRVATLERRQQGAMPVTYLAPERIAYLQVFT